MSELGDKTFFIAAILAMRNNKLTVFLAAISALAVMTVLSALLGEHTITIRSTIRSTIRNVQIFFIKYFLSGFVVTTFIPREYTYYTCTAIMFLFGKKIIN